MNIKTISKKIIFGISSLIPFSLINKFKKINLILPYYHVISDKNIPHIKHLYKYKNVKQFNSDMDFLLKYYKPATLYNLIDFVKLHKPLYKDCFFLSFDDGLIEIYEIIAPILKKKGIPATFFLVTDFIDNKKLSYRFKISLIIEIFLKKNKSIYREKVLQVFRKNGIINNNIINNILSIQYNSRSIIEEIANILEINFTEYLKKNTPYLTTKQIESLLKDGFTIGAHSVNHPNYNNLSTEEQLSQTIQSIKYLRNKFSLEYSAFAFPFDDQGVSETFFKRLHSYDLIDISFGTNSFMEDAVTYNFQRNSMEELSNSPKNILSYQFLKKIVLSKIGKNKINRNLY